MKVICVGMPKTGTKSLCTALRTLGLNVYDFEEQIWFTGAELQQALTTGCTKEEFRKMFEGVDATTDFPVSLIWESVADAFPEAKIIHMEREGEEVWYKSFLNQVDVARNNIMIRIFMFLTPTGYRLQKLMSACTRVGWGFPKSNPIVRKPVNEMVTKMKYRQHNSHVRRTVAKERLLIYKLGDGWKPLCEFLDLPEPDEPFPHRNKGGVIVDELLEDSLIFKRVKLETSIIMLIATTLGVMLLGYLYNYMTSGCC